MRLAELLQVKPGVTAVTGSGGKTSLIEFLAKELAGDGTVLVATTTKIWPPAFCPVLTGASTEDVREALRKSPVVCVGEPVTFTGPDGRTETKFSAPRIPIADLSKEAVYILIEADGAKRKPLKAHALYEPVIPEEAGTVIQVVGTGGIGRPVSEAVHRPELFLELLGDPAVVPETIVTPEAVAAVLLKEIRGDVLFLNQTDTEEDRGAARRLAGYVKEAGYRAIVAGSLQQRRFECLY